MYWIDIQEKFNDLVIGTYGRGIWICDDISPLQQLSEEIAASDAHLFQPKEMIRLRPVTRIMQFFPEPHFGTDPENGGAIDYWLAAANDSVQMHIVDNSGDTVRTLKHKGKPGLNRVMWDFTSDPSDEIKLHTKPQYADWYEMNDKRERNAQIGRIRVLCPPGEYTVNAKIGDATFERTFSLVKDPNSEGSEEDIAKQVAILHSLKDDMNKVGEMIGQVEDIRRQLIDMGQMMEASEKKKIGTELSALQEKLIAFESKLLQMKQTGHGQDVVRWPVQLAERIFYLASTVATSDFAPADPHVEVHQILQQRISDYQEEWREIVGTDVAAFAELLQQQNIGPLMYASKP